jgi:transcriptional regulator with GAF, ATPase, and Fis domain
MVYLYAMFPDKDYQPEYDTLRDFLVQMAEERAADALPGMIVRQMASRPHVALAQVWLLRPGDLCSECAYAPPCADHSLCLHLVASEGRAETDAGNDGFSLRIRDRRVSLDSAGHGEAVRKGVPVRISNPELRGPDGWAQRTQIASASYYPIAFKGEVLGLIGIYSTIALRRIPEGLFWLTMIANQTAVAVANARALDQIERLRAQLELENAYLREEVVDAGAFGDIIGKSPPLANLLEQVTLVAPTNASVLILGESGTGKELLAREIHRRSLRSDRPMIKVNCAAIPAELYESEFFGHVKGAFTGAVADRAGRFQAADGGTLFLDEVGEIPLALQGKLLRVLQEGSYERIGEEVTRQVDVRIIAATNRDLKKEVAAGRFRQDLYYRLNVFPIEVVPLRLRKEDIPLLAEHFLRTISAKMNRPAPGLTRSLVVELQAYGWPGNVRELQNVVERAIITSRSGRLRFDLPQGRPSLPVPVPCTGVAISSPEEPGILTENEVRQQIRSNIATALTRCRGKIYGPDGAAALLGVSPTTLCSRIQRLKIRVDTAAPELDR